ncbi:MAG TPA: hypothetical protein PKD79_00220 [Candidatus Doudnabacteria bacterium]|nr:hypothetical protein [Candidatus Doudnabacteria bacterium]
MSITTTATATQMIGPTNFTFDIAPYIMIIVESNEGIYRVMPTPKRLFIITPLKIPMREITEGELSFRYESMLYPAIKAGLNLKDTIKEVPSVLRESIERVARTIAPDVLAKPDIKSPYTEEINVSHANIEYTVKLKIWRI